MTDTRPVPRAYDSTRRGAATAATRERILEAARAILGGKGNLDDFSMETIATRAGVARMTVYYQFGSRAGLLESLADHLAERGGMARMRDVFLEPALPVAFRKLVETFVGFWASDRVTLRRMRALAITDPKDASAPRDRDAWRREAIANLLARHRYRGPTGRGGALDELIDALSALTSFEMFDLLAQGGRTPDRVASLLADLGLRELGLASPARSRGHSR